MIRDAKLADLIEQSPCVLDERQLGPLTDKDPEWRHEAVFMRDEVIGSANRSAATTTAARGGATRICRRWAGGTGGDMRATFITLAIEDGADPETRMTYTRKSRSAFDGYNRGLHWKRTCGELFAPPARLRCRAADRRVRRPHRPVARYTARYSPATSGDDYGKSWRRRESKATMLTLHDAPGQKVREVPAAPGAPNVAGHHGASSDRSELATAAADPVIAELEAALAMRLAGAEPKVLRRVLRRIEELLDE